MALPPSSLRTKGSRPRIARPAIVITATNQSYNILAIIRQSPAKAAPISPLRISPTPTITTWELPHPAESTVRLRRSPPDSSRVPQRVNRTRLSMFSKASRYLLQSSFYHRNLTPAIHRTGSHTMGNSFEASPRDRRNRSFANARRYAYISPRRSWQT